MINPMKCCFKCLQKQMLFYQKST
uniref:Uncharacterized protein n=1 Tax=Anguilla anguilla TaxID=7936 RepID=A0A0E9QE37_ANGAN